MPDHSLPIDRSLCLYSRRHLAEILGASPNTIKYRLEHFDWQQWPIGDLLTLAQHNDELFIALRRFFVPEPDAQPMQAQDRLIKMVKCFQRLSQRGFDALSDGYLDNEEAQSFLGDLLALYKDIPQLIADLEGRAQQR